jgi:hypothetical protein
MEISSITFKDPLAFSLKRRDFEGRTLRLLKMSRAALIYLSLAVCREERLKGKKRGSEGIIVGEYLGTWEDEWKV